MILTYKFRIKDATSRKRLERHARSVNFVWNYCCEIQRKAESNRKAGRHVFWPTHFDLERSGLEITKTFYTGYARQFTPQWRKRIGSPLSGFPLLATSAFSSERAKYDSIRVHAKLNQ